MSETSNDVPGPTVVVERLGADGRRYAIQVRVKQLGDDLVMDHMSALHAHELLKSAATE